MNPRRSVYFLFHGLLTAVLVLIVWFEHHRFEPLLLILLAVPMAAVRLVPERMLAQWWFQSSFFVADAAVVTYAIHAPVTYLVYLAIILSTAMTRSYKQSVTIGLVSCSLFLLANWKGGPPADTLFWLRFQLLIIATCILSVLSGDAQVQERKHRSRLVEAERLATLGRVAGEVAHRIKGPLTTIRVNAEYLEHKFAPNRAALSQLKEIEEEVDHCKQILKGLLDLGRIEEMDFEPIDLRAPVRAAMDAVQTQMKSRGVTLQRAGFSRAVKVRGDGPLLQEAVTAMLHNALEADCKFILVSLEKTRLVIEDDGRGLDQDELEKAFQPFFTTKEGGSGLGLSAAMRIAQKHGGTLEAQSEGRGRGARFVLSI